MTAWQKEQLGVKCIYCWREAFCTTVTWNREVADCDLRCVLWTSQSCRQGCQQCSPQNWHTTFITAWARQGESAATATTHASYEWREELTLPLDMEAWFLGAMDLAWKNTEKPHFSKLLSVGGEGILVAGFWHLILLLSETSCDSSL